MNTYDPFDEKNRITMEDFEGFKNNKLQLELFAVPPTEPEPKPELTCRHCKNRFYHEYTVRLMYCRKKRDKNTATGCKKVKASDPACGQFEKKEKP